MVNVFSETVKILSNTRHLTPEESLAGEKSAQNITKTFDKIENFLEKTSSQSLPTEDILKILETDLDDILSNLSDIRSLLVAVIDRNRHFKKQKNTFN